jgi:hypothetical protein
MTATYLIITLLLIVLEMGHEGLKLRGRHIASEWIEFFYLAFIWLVVFFWATDTFQSTLSSMKSAHNKTYDIPRLKAQVRTLQYLLA